MNTVLSLYTDSKYSKVGDKLSLGEDWLHLSEHFGEVSSYHTVLLAKSKTQKSHYSLCQIQGLHLCYEPQVSHYS